MAIRSTLNRLLRWWLISEYSFNIFISTPASLLQTRTSAAFYAARTPIFLCSGEMLPIFSRKRERDFWLVGLSLHSMRDTQSSRPNWTEMRNTSDILHKHFMFRNKEHSTKLIPSKFRAWQPPWMDLARHAHRLTPTRRTVSIEFQCY